MKFKLKLDDDMLKRLATHRAGCETCQLHLAVYKFRAVLFKENPQAGIGIKPGHIRSPMYNCPAAEKLIEIHMMILTTRHEYNDHS